MNTVYILTCISRSDACYGSHYVGCFSTIEKAKRRAEEIRDSWTISEQVLDSNNKTIVDTNDL